MAAGERLGNPLLEPPQRAGHRPLQPVVAEPVVPALKVESSRRRSSAYSMAAGSGSRAGCCWGIRERSARNVSMRGGVGGTIAVVGARDSD